MPWFCAIYGQDITLGVCRVVTQTGEYQGVIFIGELRILSDLST